MRFSLDVILTRADGTPFERPQREDFDDVVEYVRAVNAFWDEVTDSANKAFDKAFQKAVRKAEKRS